MGSKRLLVLRHAKSSWSDSGAADFDRPLNGRGREAARLIGQVVHRTGQVPQLVLGSAATRTRQTVELAIEEGVWSCAVEWRRELYEASPEDVLRLLRRVDDRVGSVLVAGHQPTSSELVSLLVGGGELRFPTAALACLELSVERWSQLAAGVGALHWLLVPRLLGPLLGGGTSGAAEETGR
jgi:phosphohistidine phosphatase